MERPHPKDHSKKDNKDARQPDPETLHTTDPQEHMKGPVSSLVQKAKETIEEKGAEKPDEAKD
jgi:hypothetical protein